jgi:hypothetical protein
MNGASNLLDGSGRLVASLAYHDHTNVAEWLIPTEQPACAEWAR